jgi:hypothetical protein
MRVRVSSAVSGPAAVVVWALPAVLRGFAGCPGLGTWSALDGDVVGESLGGLGVGGVSCVW